MSFNESVSFYDRALGACIKSEGSLSRNFYDDQFKRNKKGRGGTKVSKDHGKTWIDFLQEMANCLKEKKI